MRVARPTNNLNNILKAVAKEERRACLQPKSGDLLGDVLYLERGAIKQSNAITRGIFARATIVMSVAAMEAITNDALATIHELLTETVPSESANKAPWCLFMGRSVSRIDSLLRRGSFVKKRQYILSHIKRIAGQVPEASLSDDINLIVRLRNRIVHMNYYQRPIKYQSMLDPKQSAPIAIKASFCARHYVNFLREKFWDINLPITTTSHMLFIESPCEAE